MSNQPNIGDQIRNAVQDAIERQDYTALRQTVEQGINAATDAIGRGIASAQATAQQNAERRAERASWKPPQQADRRTTPSEQRRQLDAAKRQQAALARQQHEQSLVARQQQRRELAAVAYRYAKGGSAKAAGVGMTLGGTILALGFAGGGVSMAALGAAVGGIGFGIVGIAMVAGLVASVALIVSGARRMSFADRFAAYRRVLGTRQACEVAELQRAVGRSREDVLKDLRRMIAKGMFTQGHLNAAETQLCVTNEAYQYCLQSERQLAEKERIQRLTQPASGTAQGQPRLSAEQQALLTQGNAYVARIRSINDQIPDPELSAKIHQIETVVQKIFEYAGQHPDVIDDLQRLMDYYLPTTVKLLDAYADLDSQPVQGENITTAKREIEGTLDTLSVAFERLLDSVFKDMTWDVSTDISVLHAVLAQEGLVEGAFEGIDGKDRS